MPKDEFNSVEVHNDSSYTVFEFGSTPKTGIFNQRENKSTVSRDEVNDSATKNHENFSSEEGVDQNNFKQQKDLIDKLNTNEGNTVVDSSSSSSTSTASEASAASGGASAAAACLEDDRQGARGAQLFRGNGRKKDRFGGDLLRGGRALEQRRAAV